MLRTKTCTSAINTVFNCEPLNLLNCFCGECIPHALSGASNAAMAPGVYNDSETVNLKEMQKALLPCITWKKKRPGAKRAWFAPCQKMKKKERLMPTPVKTSFGSTGAMIVMMLEYEEVVDDCYSNHPSLELRSRSPDVKHGKQLE